MELLWPSTALLPFYVDALQRGWTPDTLRGAAAAGEELRKIAMDPAGFVDSLVDREAAGPPISLPDGSTVPRLPGYKRWLWDGEFCGMISFRWRPGTAELPPNCLGHIGYAVVPWKQGRGYAKEALRLMLSEVRAEGLPYVDLTTNPENLASQRVILANGGVLVGRFSKPAGYAPGEGLRFRIALA